MQLILHIVLGIRIILVKKWTKSNATTSLSCKWTLDALIVNYDVCKLTNGVVWSNGCADVVIKFVYDTPPPIWYIPVNSTHLLCPLWIPASTLFLALPGCPLWIPASTLFLALPWYFVSSVLEIFLVQIWKSQSVWSQSRNLNLCFLIHDVNIDMVVQVWRKLICALSMWLSKWKKLICASPMWLSKCEGN
jgi:hypothetical protein